MSSLCYINLKNNLKLYYKKLSVAKKFKYLVHKKIQYITFSKLCKKKMDIISIQQKIEGLVDLIYYIINNLDNMYYMNIQKQYNLLLVIKKKIEQYEYLMPKLEPEKIIFNIGLKCNVITVKNKYCSKKTYEYYCPYHNTLLKKRKEKVHNNLPNINKNIKNIICEYIFI
jgi:hypothetical protein